MADTLRDFIAKRERELDAYYTEQENLLDLENDFNAFLDQRLRPTLSIKV